MKIKNMMIAACLILAAGTFAGEAKTIEEIWAEIKDKPNPAKNDNFELLRGLPLLVVAKGVKPDATALTAVLKYQFHNETKTGKADVSEDFSDISWMLSEKLEQIFAGAYPEKHLSKDESASLAGWFQKTYASKLERVSKKKGIASKIVDNNQKLDYEKWDSFTVNASHFVELYFRNLSGRKTIADAARNFAEDHNLSVTVENEKQVQWDKYKVLLDRGVPVILQNKDEILVGIGYYVDEANKYAIVYNPSKAEYRITTGEENVTKGELESLEEKPTTEFRLAIQNAIRLKMKRKTRRDFVSKLKQPLPKGVGVRTNISTFSACFLYDWKVNEKEIKKAIDMLVKELKLDRKKLENEK